MQETRDDAEGARPPETEMPGTAADRDEAVSGAAPGGGAGAPSGEAAEYKDRWLRAEADLQNFRRRARRETDEARRNAEEAVLLDLVSWLDDLERALRSASESGAAAAWADGVALMLQKGRDYLERQGVTSVDPVGLPFDPTLHEAILEVDGPEGAAPGSVVQTVQKGYRRGDRALRAARVVVARGVGGEE